MAADGGGGDGIDGVAAFPVAAAIGHIDIGSEIVPASCERIPVPQAACREQWAHGSAVREGEARLSQTISDRLKPVRIAPGNHAND